MYGFRYDDAILERFPAIRAGVIVAHGVRNGATPRLLAEAYEMEQQAVLMRIGETPLSQLPSLAAWRRAFTAFGVKPTQYRSAAEALLRRLTKQGSIPSVNLLVDLGNLVSIRYALPVAVVDLAQLTGPITVQFATGSERFTNLDADEADRPIPGEVIFVDEAGLVCARRWCWRQSDETGARDTTTGILITVEGHHDSADQDIAGALADLQTLLIAHQPGVALQAGQLSPEQPAFLVEA
ncbi:MAG: hypothetical protein GXY36_09110 [Chloroflexi bacterium]|nr:hypothetical protein [Chloroflexota bacterium]